MKRQDYLIIKGLDIKELELKVKTLRQDLEGLVLEKNRNVLKDLKSISKKKKDISQVLTVIKQKQLLAQLEPKIEKGDKK
ncbi:hypothetical protein A3C59_01340 [Candidatus Daviesbacteria bacterium RIFCSPHIGHO2_02_FULL_36_13]|uniref:Large ribosomal subunit protein uL29 n=1 Tax=Candidatus Daviesbacteria bacterium RIFCSPHIGHO2_02_FULL_36_13 TaxID=1797768 RepID=A0A1F5JZ87_9BACT|nr:MAG: hypothetical protein A3C59_01340 [Candidatus Daviesbacteria bacterium RIFCSPHIGHO2_02_FULL_36_13]OGE44473.1 MAG: hypothetical protein A3A45_00665 [Candidatus Daviesbacteria bacterium RIFCSPLOWO2_01_FULL_36_8]